jgi:hypothetical protein
MSRVSTRILVRLLGGTAQDEARVRARIAEDARVCFGLEATETADGGVEVEGEEGAVVALWLHIHGAVAQRTQEDA